MRRSQSCAIFHPLEMAWLTSGATVLVVGGMMIFAEAGGPTLTGRR